MDALARLNLARLANKLLCERRLLWLAWLAWLSSASARMRMIACSANTAAIDGIQPHDATDGENHTSTSMHHSLLDI